MQRSSFKKRLTGFILLASILSGSFAAFAQKRAATKTNVPTGQMQMVNQKTEKKKECKGNYSGVVTYKREIKQYHLNRYGGYYDNKSVFESVIPIRDDGSTQGAIYPSVSGIEGSFNFYGAADATKNATVTDLQVSEKDDYCKMSIAGMNGKTRERCETLAVTKEEAMGRGSSFFCVFKAINITFRSTIRRSTARSRADQCKLHGKMRKRRTV